MELPERARSRPPVMTDVAQLAGVSHQTVSRVLNDHPNVRPQTRALVLAAITELGYRPNAAARTLVTRRTHTLGVISFDTTLYGPASMLYGIERAARDSYFVAIASVPALDRRSVLDAVDRFVGQGVEGIIVIAPQDSAVEALYHVPEDIPLRRGGLPDQPAGALGRGGQRRGRRAGHPAPARPGPPHRASPGRAGRLAGRAGPGGRLAAGAARGGRRGAAAAGRRLVRRHRVRPGPADRARTTA